MAMIENIYETMNLRITETAFELHLRKIYPTRNILSMRETETISGQECLDVQKKTDGSVNIIGEVATDPVASWMIQSAQVASKFTLFTHHAKTFPDLVTALRNSMLRAGVFTDEYKQEPKNLIPERFPQQRLYNITVERLTEPYMFKETDLEGKYTGIIRHVFSVSYMIQYNTGTVRNDIDSESMRPITVEVFEYPDQTQKINAIAFSR